jgi:hypothetical protein
VLREQNMGWLKTPPDTTRAGAHINTAANDRKHNANQTRIHMQLGFVLLLFPACPVQRDTRTPPADQGQTLLLLCTSLNPR